jgi:hypothetical protein
MDEAMTVAGNDGGFMVMFILGIILSGYAVARWRS